MSPFYLVYQRHANFPLDFACTDLESKNAAVEALVNTRQKTLALAHDNLVKAREHIITHHQHKHLPTPFKLTRHGFSSQSRFPQITYLT